MSTTATATEDDLIGGLIEAPEDTATIVADPINGYDRIIPTPDVLKEMGELYAREITVADRDWAPVFEAQRAAERVYEAVSDKNEVITLPVAKRVINQQVAWITDALLSKDPIIGVKPIDGGSYEIPAGISDAPKQPPAGSPDGTPPQPILQTKIVTAEEAARNFQDLLQHKWTVRLEMEQVIEDTVQAVHTCDNPTWWRIDYDPQVRRARTRNYVLAPGGVQIYGLRDTEVTPRDAVNIRHVAGQNITMPITSRNEQEAWWVAERTPLKNSDLWEGVKNGRYDFCLPAGKDGKPAEVPDSQLHELFGLAEDSNQSDPNRGLSGGSGRARLDMLIASVPNMEHDVRTLYMYHPFRVTDTATGLPTIKIMSCIGTLHVKSMQLLNLMVNWSWSGERLLIPHFRHRRPHRFSGQSAASDVAPLQNLMSSVFHLQIQNAVQQNVKVFLIRENTATWKFFKRQGTVLRPGLIVPFEDKDDINPIQLGAPVESMAPHITFLDGQAERLMVTSDFDLGVNIPGRTPAATVNQVESMAKMQPMAVLRSLRRSIAKGARLYLETVAQFNAYETIPFLDPEKRMIVSRMIGFPREVISHHFSFYATATGNEDTKQARFEKAGLLIQDTDPANAAAMQFAKIIFDPGTPPPAKELAKFLWLRRERLYGEKIRTMSLDTQHYVVTDEFITKLMAEMPPPAPPAPPTGPGGPGGAPPPPPPPIVKVSLSGKLTPDQENAAAQSVLGVGGTSGPGGVADGQQQQTATAAEEKSEGEVGGGNSGSPAAPQPAGPQLPPAGPAGPPVR